MQLESRIEQYLDMKRFFVQDEKQAQWICLEGKPNKKFLHLEDVRMNDPLSSLKNKKGIECTNMDEILEILQDFYQELYSADELSLIELEIKGFLNNITSLPCLKSVPPELVGPITTAEVEVAIKCLHLGKAPGSDELTADFYKHYSEYLVDVLVKVFNKIYGSKDLTPTQKLAIITLIFKKGDTSLVMNYWPISLTNCDYKILAYILVSHLEGSLPLLIHPNQIAYMKEHFIGMNIHSVQDFITDTVDKDSVVLFLDFHKAFDSVNYLFLLTLLANIGLPAEFILWVSILYG